MRGLPLDERGRAADGSDHRYSDAMKRANVVWNAVTLDKWLTDPEALIRAPA
jgi:cytochrome c2